MDRSIWQLLRNAVRSADRSVPRFGRKPQFSDQLVVKMFFWSVMRDRPRCFACRRENYPSWIRLRHMPSYSQFCRRLHSPRVIEMIKHVARRMGESERPIQLAFIDGKELPISRASRDPDARVGRGHRQWHKGYKVHALGGDDQRIKAFAVRPMNEGEPRIAREELMSKVPRGVVVLADANYDSKFLYDEARRREAWFLAPIKKVPAKSRSGTSDARRIGIAMWEKHPRLTKAVYQQRVRIERIFSACTCFGGGLAPLPTWVRRLDRVTLWVTAKIAIYHARLTVRERRTAA